MRHFKHKEDKDKFFKEFLTLPALPSDCIINLIAAVLSKLVRHKIS
jgi:hypothetical protein